MRPVHAVILILAGALAGALIVKVAPKPHPAAPTPVIAQVQAPPVAVPQPAAEPETPPAPTEPAKPSPMPKPVAVRHEAPKPLRSHPDVTPAERPMTGDPEPVERPAAPPDAAPPSSPTVAPPPAAAEPEHVTPASPKAPAAPAPQPHQVTLNAGSLLPVRLVDGLSSEHNVPGDTFTGTLDRELVVDGFVIAERGARVEGRVVAADRGGKVRGTAALAVELTRLHTSDGQRVPIQTESFFKHAEASHGQDATKVGAGAAIGAVLGAIAGGGKGAAIGAGVGGGAGAGDVLLTRGKPAELPSETRVTFRLKNPVALTERLGR